MIEKGRCCRGVGTPWRPWWMQCLEAKPVSRASNFAKPAQVGRPTLSQLLARVLCCLDAGLCFLSLNDRNATRLGDRLTEPGKEDRQKTLQQKAPRRRDRSWTGNSCATSHSSCAAIIIERHSEAILATLPSRRVNRPRPRRAQDGVEEVEGRGNRPQR